MSYSTLFNDGLHQLWDTKYKVGRARPDHIAISVFSTASSKSLAKPTYNVFQSFLSFDESSLGSIYEASSSGDSLASYSIASASLTSGPEYKVPMYPASVSRRSFESAVTVPQASRKSRPSSSSGLVRRRSLPNAKPVPRTIPPPTPVTSKRSSATSWLPRIAVSRFHPSLPYCSKASDSEQADEEGDGLSDSSASSSSSKRTKNSANSISKISTTSLSSTSTVTVNSPPLRLAPLPHPSVSSYSLPPSSVPISVSEESDLELPHISVIPLPPSPQGDSLSFSSRSTVSTRYRKAKRSDALAQLEGRKSAIPPVPPLPFVHTRSHSTPQVLSTAPRPSGGQPYSLVLPKEASFVSFTEDEDSGSGRETHVRYEEPGLLRLTALTNVSDVASRDSSRRSIKFLHGWKRRRRNFIDLR